MELVKRGVVTKSEMEDYVELSEAVKNYITSRDELIKMNETVKGEKIVEAFSDKYMIFSNEVSKIIDTMLSDKTNMVDEVSVNLNTHTSFFTVIMIAIIIVAIIIALILAKITSMGISEISSQIKKSFN